VGDAQTHAKVCGLADHLAVDEYDGSRFEGFKTAF